ncbi:flagellar hook assembly protein FlgD [Actinoplanes rectilineatus]|uniref:flagellar hook assembly protein FlgD n=1 Tax=Actinoplanes rectilineatus TaxID=113571 RepID=UPI000A796A99|nr:flagellar hook capping FlgD N-terminal domain-containing protein [Actinoplanes rectilineatus]
MTSPIPGPTGVGAVAPATAAPAGTAIPTGTAIPGSTTATPGVTTPGAPAPGIAIPGMPGVTAQSSEDMSRVRNLADKDTFLKLLVAQLRYQDPMKPADSTAFLAQTAQFTQVEKLQELLDSMRSQRLVTAGSMVGRTVAYMDEAGARQTGVITSAKLNGDSDPTLTVGNRDVALSKVLEIRQDGAAPDAEPAAPATATPATAAPAAVSPAAVAPAEAVPVAAVPAAIAPAAAIPTVSPQIAEPLPLNR